jgi:hypothetical protein
MTSNPRGICLIINISKFSGSGDTDGNCQQLETREGSEMDVTALQSLFNSFQFVVVVHSGEITEAKLWKIVDEVAKDTDHSSYDAFVCCVMSHGNLVGFLRAMVNW